MFKRVLLTYHLPTTEFKLKKIGQQLLINTSLVSSTNYGRSNFLQCDIVDVNQYFLWAFMKPKPELASKVLPIIPWNAYVTIILYRCQKLIERCIDKDVTIEFEFIAQCTS